MLSGRRSDAPAAFYLELSKLTYVCKDLCTFLPLFNFFSLPLPTQTEGNGQRRGATRERRGVRFDRAFGGSDSGSALFLKNTSLTESAFC